MWVISMACNGLGADEGSGEGNTIPINWALKPCPNISFFYVLHPFHEAVVKRPAQGHTGNKQQS